MSDPITSSRREWAVPIPLLLLCALLLLVGAATSSYEYLKLMRWVVFLAFAWSGFIAWHSDRKVAVVLHVTIAILFNPFFRPHIAREVWVALDLSAALIAVLIAWATRPQAHDKAERENLADFFGFSVGFAGLVAGVMAGLQIAHSLGLGEVLGGLLAFALASAFLYGSIYIFHGLRTRFFAKGPSK